MSHSTLGKRKRFLDEQQDQLHRAISEQFDLEIALKRRLLAFAKARLEWAGILRDSIIDKCDNAPVAGFPPTAFRDAALATYQAIEGPCHFIVSSADGPSRIHINGGSAMRPDIRATDIPRTRKRTTLALGHGVAAGPLLFEDTSTSTPVTLKLRCLDCSRCDFPTMQGFLNHCRLAHLRIYGTHDECIQACGVMLDDDERKALVLAGVEIKTISLFSLKRIFERAVGLGQNVGPDHDDAAVTQLGDETSYTSTHLSQTLGLHKDTPTLAPFLGKEMKKKVIHVYDEEKAIEIVELENDTPSKPCLPWMFKRKKSRILGDEIMINTAVLTAEKTGETEGPECLLNPTSGQGSRFHIMRRISVSDRSLYLPPTKRPLNPETKTHTHRWQLSVSSPSYEQHISTFLSRLTVACVTQPPVFTSPITVLGPPFIACSTTDRPFLARLTLKWTGDQNNDFVVEHWVELDQLKSARPVLGETQMLDVELDRNTNFQPASTGVATVPWTSEGDHVSSCRANSPLSDRNIENELAPTALSNPPHIQLLKSIVPRFPITLQDLDSRQPPRVPYEVHLSPGKLLGLVMGRRKAIEWSRATAIRDEYNSLITSPSDGHVHLTTADVYRWLESEGLFPRPRRKVQKSLIRSETSKSTPTSAERVTDNFSFCCVCGVNVRFHTPGIPIKSGEQSEGEATGFQCPSNLEWRRVPLVHLFALVAPSRIPYWVLRSDSFHHGITKSSPRDIISLAHPHITRLVRQEASSLHLSRFKALHAESGYELPFGGSRDELEEFMAPYALLGAAVERIVRDLVGSALQAAGESQGRTKTASVVTRGVPIKSLLTPTHVLQGLVQGAEMGGPKEAVFKCLMRVGTVLEQLNSGGA